MRTPLPPRTFARRLLDSPIARTGTLWVFLVVVFVAMFQWHDHPAPGGGNEVEGSGSWVGLIVREAPFVGLLALIGMFLWRLRRFTLTNKAGIDLMAAGNFAEAADTFRRLGHAWFVPTVAARLNHGLALLRLGNLDAALEALASAERSWTRWYRPVVASFLSLCQALRGDLEAADAWAAEARRRGTSPSSFLRVHLAAQAIVRLRRSDAQGAVELLRESWGEIERSTAADLVRAFRIVRALASESAGSPLLVPDLLSGARPFRPGEYAWLGAGWPEMARYLEANGFAKAA